MSFKIKRKRKFIALFIALIMTFGVTGCTKNNNESSNSTATADSASVNNVSENDMFTDRDKEVGYDESSAVTISFSSSGVVSSSDSVSVSNNTVTIKNEGTYIITGTSSNGQIVVDADKKTKVQLVLKNASITCESSAPLYVKQADKVFVTTAKDTENTLASKGEYIQSDDNNIDATIFSKDDITLNGEGKLTVTSEKGHGIVSKNDLKLTSGEYEITAAGHTLTGKDSVRIASGKYTLTSEKDGIHSENTDDTSKGFVYILDGEFTINCKGDGIDAGAYVQIENGDYNITSSNSISSSTDTASVKGIKSDGNLTINDGTYNIECDDDALHSNSNVTITNGVFNISSGDDGIHADNKTSISGGTINITKSYEGIEGNEVEISGGNITLKASDDGINAAGGKDESGYGGKYEKDNFKSSDDKNALINITGGKIIIEADGDGIDANGTITISGGETYISGPTSGGDGALDYDKDAIITGGIVVAAGSSRMAENFGENSTQGSMLVNINSSGEISVKNSSGDVLVSYTPTKKYECVVISTPDIVKDETYTVTGGDTSTEVEMTSLIYGSRTMGGDPGNMDNNMQPPNGDMGKGGMKHPDENMW